MMKKIDIATLLDEYPSTITRISKGERKISLSLGRKLNSAFPGHGLEHWVGMGWDVIEKAFKELDEVAA